jgi:hypothetical protein
MSPALLTARRLIHRLLHTSHNGQQEKHGVNRYLRPPLPPCLTLGDLVDW